MPSEILEEWAREVARVSLIFSISPDAGLLQVSLRVGSSFSMALKTDQSSSDCLSNGLVTILKLGRVRGNINGSPHFFPRSNESGRRQTRFTLLRRIPLVCSKSRLLHPDRVSPVVALCGFKDLGLPGSLWGGPSTNSEQGVGGFALSAFVPTDEGRGEG